MSTQPARPVRPWRRLLTALAVLAGVGLLGFLLLFGMLWWTVSGGWDGIRRQVQPDDRQVVTAREQALATLPERQASLNRTFGEPLAHGTVDACHGGRNNWKLSEGYTLRCSTAVVAVYPWPSGLGPDGVTQLQGRIDQAGFQELYDGSGVKILDGHATTGAYRRGQADVHVHPNPAAPPQSILDVYYPDGDAHLVADTDQIEPAITRSTTPTVSVILTETYFQDDSASG